MPKSVARLLMLALLPLVGLVALAPSASAATGTIQGTVTGLTTGSPVDAWVFVYSAEPETDVFTDPCADANCVGSVRTNASGAFAVSGLAVGSYKVFVQSNDPGTYSRWYGGKGDSYSRATSVAAPNGGATSISVRLTVKGGISGTVSDDVGVQPDVTVTAYQVNADGTQNPTGKNVTTDRSGHYQISSLSSGNYRVIAGDASHVAAWNGGAASFATAANVVVADWADTTGVNFTLARYGSISGTVTDETSAPVSGASVEAHQVTGAADAGVVRTTTTAANGTYTLGTLAPGTYRVKAVPSGLTHGPAWNGSAESFTAASDITVTSGSTISGTDITVPAFPGGISGTVTPVLAGTTVTALIPYAGGQGVTTTVDGAGNFMLAVPAGLYLLRVDPPASRPDYPSSYVYQHCEFGDCWWVTNTSALDVGWGGDRYIGVDAGAVVSGATANLTQVPVLAGRITDTHGDPVANASVQLWLRGMDVSGGVPTSANLYGEDACFNDYWGYLNPQPCRIATTDADGNYLIYPPLEWPVAWSYDQRDYVVLVVPQDGLHRPRWVGAESDANLPDSWPSENDMYGGEWVTVPGYGSAPEQIDLDQVLNGAGRLSGTLTSSAGGPATEVKVRVHSNLDDGSPAAGRNYLTTTAEDGTWSVGGLPAGAYSVFFADGSDHYAPYAYDAGGSMAVAAYQSRTGIDATLQVGGRISGMITGDAGSGPGPVTGATVHAYLPAGGEVASAETGAAGFYQLALAPGTYRLYVTPPTGAEYAPEWYGAGATSQETAADLVVTLGSDATADAQLAFTGGPVTPVATTLATTSNSAWIAAGKSATLTGVLEDDTGQGVAGAELTLQARQGVSGAFHDAGSATTSSTGEASLSVSPTVTTTYRWVYAGDSGHLATTGTSTVVEVAFALTAKATKRTVKHTTTATVWGKVKPARKGTTVVLQRLVKGAWLTTTTTTKVKLQRLPGATHKTLGYLLKVKKPVGTYTFRVVAPATGTNVLGASGRLRITFT